MKRKKKPTRQSWAIVATAHTGKGLREAASFRRGCGIDCVEVRLDCLGQLGPRLPKMLEKIELPLILTARHPREGGRGGLSSARRAAMLESFLSMASFIDVELRSARDLGSTLRKVRRHGAGLIVSFHDFSGTPSAKRLRAKVRESLLLGASLVKLAVTLRGPRDLQALLAVQATSGKIATMGMGPLGKVSRLVLPLAGSRLVYGYLDRPQVEGQWPAKSLAARLAELAP